MPKPHFEPLNESRQDISDDMYQDNFRPEHNESYTRSSDEEQRFYSLAKEALVATAASTSENKILDPTINDLLTRLQYVLSPHGNPIKHGENIKVNDNGQLMIQDFYSSFPNMNNDIFALPSNAASPQQGSSSGANAPTPAFRSNLPSTSMGANLSMSLLNNTTPTLSPNDDWYEDTSRKFQCSKCSMSFRRSSDLKRHEKQHLTIPPNICEFCGKGFARKDALKRHVGTATCKRNSEKQLYADNLEYLRSKART